MVLADKCDEDVKSRQRPYYYQSSSALLAVLRSGGKMPPRPRTKVRCPVRTAALPIAEHNVIKKLSPSMRWSCAENSTGPIPVNDTVDGRGVSSVDPSTDVVESNNGTHSPEVPFHAEINAYGTNHGAIKDDLDRSLRELDAARQTIAEHVAKENVLAKQVENYREENKRHIEENAIKSADLDRASLNMGLLTDRVENYRKDHDRLIEESRIHENDLDVVKSSLQDALKVISEKEAQVEAYRKDNERVGEENCKVQAENLGLLDTYQKATESNITEHKILLGRITCYRQKNGQLVEENATQAKNLRLADLMLRKARSTASSLKRAKEEWESQYDVAVSGAKDLAAKLTATSLQLASVTKNMRLQDEALNRKIVAAASQFNVERSRLSSELKKERDEKQIVKMRLDISRTQCSSSLAEKDNLQRQLDKTKSKQNNLRFELWEAQCEIQSLIEDKRCLEADLEEFRSRVLSLSSDQDELQKQLVKVQINRNRTRSKLKEAQSKIESLTEENWSLEERIDRLRQRKNDTKRELDEAQERQLEMNSKLQKTQSLKKKLEGEKEDLEHRLEKMKRKHTDLQSDLRDAQAKFALSDIAKWVWRREVDDIQRQMSVAQRHIRSVDLVTTFQLEVRQDLVDVRIKRCKNHPPSATSSKLIKAIQNLNSAISKHADGVISASNTVFARTRSTQTTKRANTVLGDFLVSIVQKQANQSRYSAFSDLMPMVLRLFMVVWCSAIIEGHYPKRRTFSDLLVALATEPTPCTGRDSQNLSCGQQAQVISKSTGGEYRVWAQEILDDLSAILAVWGLFINLQGEEYFKERFISLLKDAYKIRTSLAEKDLCGNLELSVVSSNASFQPSKMDATYRATNGTQKLQKDELVVGTVGIGLEATDRSYGKTGIDSRVVLKPTVVVVSDLSKI